MDPPPELRKKETPFWVWLNPTSRKFSQGKRGKGSRACDEFHGLTCNYLEKKKYSRKLDKAHPQTIGSSFSFKGTAT